jgi:hypothetical protein
MGATKGKNETKHGTIAGRFATVTDPLANF